MGLSFYVQKAEPTGLRLSYGDFNRLRHRIARSIGLKGVYPMTKTDMYITGQYKEIENTHPMYPLIEHNDCDGKLEPDDCGQIGACLKMLIPAWKMELEKDPDDDILRGHIIIGEKLADLLIECHKNDNTLLFI